MIKLKSLSKIKLGTLIFFKRYSNLFIVFLIKKKHIITLTSGVCKMGKTKKQKIASHNMLNMVNKLLEYLNRFNIKYVNFIIKQKISSHFFNFQKLLKMNNIIIKSYKYIFNQQHGFRRKRKKRRI
jgi:hypothetical protein